MISVFAPTEADLELLATLPHTPAQPPQCFKDAAVAKPWGEEYLLFENADAAIWVLRIDPGCRTSFHAHPVKTTSLIVLGGRGRCKTLAAETQMGPLEAVVLGKKVFHQSFNAEAEALWLMEIESPVDKFDLVRYRDAYGRSSAYESAAARRLFPGSYMDLGSRVVGEMRVTIAFVETQERFVEETEGVHDAIITVLDRHVWSEAGEKLIEVGSSFRREDFRRDFRINDRFHYVIIHKNEGGRQP